jgi:hypothetical protein
MAGLQFAAERAGVDVDTVLGSMEDFGEVLFDFANGGGRAAEALELMDVEVQNADGSFRNTDEVLREVLGKMVAVEDTAKRNAIAQQLFGDAGNRLNAILGDAPLEQYIANAETLGLVLDNEAIARATALDIEKQIRNFTTGFVFAKEFVKGFSSEARAAFDQELELKIQEIQAEDIFDADGIADVEKAASQMERAGKLMQLQFKAKTANAFEFAAIKASAATFEFLKQRQALAAADKATADTSKSIGDLADQQERQAKANAEAARASEANAKTQAAAADKLAAITDKAAEDQLDAAGKLRRAYQAEIEQIEAVRASLDELERKGVDVSAERLAADQAFTETGKRLARDLKQARLDAIAEEQAAKDEAAQADRERSDAADAEDKARLEMIMADRQAAALGFAETTFGALDAIAARQAENAAAALSQAKADIETLKDERASLTQQLLDEENKIEAARIRARLAELDAEISAAKIARRSRRRSAKQAFAAQKAIAISEAVFNAAVATLKAYAMYGPPPSPPGIGAAAAAVAAGTLQAALIAAEKPPQFHTGIDNLLGPTAAFTGGPDERLARLTTGEAVLNARAADSIGRETVSQLNRTGGAGGGSPVFSISFEGRTMDSMIARTLGRGGRARSDIAKLTRTRPVGQIPIFRG